MRIREPYKEASIETLRRRMAYVRGEHKLWIEMADWELRESSRRTFHSEQRRHQLRKAARALQGQCLTSVSIGTRPLRTTFYFDHGSELLVVRYKRANPTWALWHFYTRRTLLALLSSGRLCHSSSRMKGTRLYDARGVNIVV